MPHDMELESGRLVYRGRPAVFLFPVEKLKLTVVLTGRSVQEYLEDFLRERIGPNFTKHPPTEGTWQDPQGRTVVDACIEYEISFLGKELIPVLANHLAFLAAQVGEEAIYFKTGEDSWTIEPHRKQ